MIPEEDFRISQLPLSAVPSPPLVETGSPTDRIIQLARIHGVPYVSRHHPHLPNFGFTIGMLIDFVNAVKELK